VTSGIRPKGKEITAPIPAALIEESFHSLIVFPTVNIEDKTSPKKNDQMMTGWLYISQLRAFARDTTADNIPMIRGKRKGREADRKASLNLIEKEAL